MNTVKGFSQWLNEQTAPAAKGAPVKPEGYTLKSNGVAYKYPFADDLAYSKYVYFNANPADITSDGAKYDAASIKAALTRILPSHSDWDTEMKPVKDANGQVISIAKGFGEQVATSVQNALEFHALMGLKKPLTFEQIIQSPKTPEAGYLIDELKPVYNALSSFDKEAVAEWNKNWPTIWKEQCKAAGLPWAV